MRPVHVPLPRRATSWIVLLGLTLGAAAASCAGNEDDVTERGADAGGSSIPGIDAAAADAADGGCDGDSRSCSPQEPTCEAEWCPVTTTHDERLGLSSVWGSGPNDVWVVGAAGSVLHWDGSSWSSASVGTTQSLYAVWGSGPNDVWAVSSPSAIFHTTGFANGAAEWSRATDIADSVLDVGSVGKPVRTIWGTSPSDVWVGGDPFVRRGSSASWGGWRSSVVDGGAAWTQASSSPITAIWGSGPGDIWVVGPASKGIASGGSSSAHTNGVIGADGVPMWTAFDTQSTDVLYAVWGSGPSDVWTVGERGTIRHVTAGATRWGIIDSPTNVTLRGIWGSGPSDVWAVGDEGTLLHYDGTTWTAATAAFAPGVKPNLFGVWGSGPSDVWAVGSGIVLHYSGPKPAAQGADR
jgi:hypothetical protein